jgi:hypothetical protein
MSSRYLVLSCVGLCLNSLAITSSRASEPAARGGCSSALVVIDRAVAQERFPQSKVAHEQKPWFWQTWQVDYRLRLDSPHGRIVTPREIAAEIEGWVSNSRVPSHALPRWSSLTISGNSGLSASTEIIKATDESQRCRERAILQIWTGDDQEAPPSALADDNSNPEEECPILSLAPGAILRVRLWLIHQHVLFGIYDPLLGRRELTLKLGSVTLRDTLLLDREHHITQPTNIWATDLPPEDRRDTRHFVSPPDSLHLEAHVPLNQYYHFPDQPVRYSTMMRLQFWYLVAPGTDGDCKVRLAQHSATPTTYKVLSEGKYEQCLTTVGRWVHVKHVFRTEPEATTLVLDFQISSMTDIGELWIDDVSLEPVGGSPEGP